MKIGIDASPIFNQRGGVGTYTLHLIDHLVRLNSGHELFLFTTSRPKEHFSFLNDPRVHLVHGSKLMIRYKIWREGIDLVHGPNFRLPGTGTKGNIVTIHDLALVKFPSFGKKKFGNQFSFWRTRQRALKASLIIADSYHTQKDIETFIGTPSERIRVIYMGVDPFFIPVQDNHRLSLLMKKYDIRKEKFILFTGTLEPRKNVRVLLEAFSENKKLRDSYSLVLAGGEGWGKQEIKELIRSKGMAGEVSITGYLPREELRFFYSYASCFVFPSLYEGFGIPPLEAMACGAPVICSNSSSLPEVVGDAAITIDPDDIDGFSSGMEKLAENEDLRKTMIQRGFERVKNFSWEETARKTLAVYEEVYLS